MNPPRELIVTAAGWNGAFYPKGLKPSEHLTFCAERFHTVEVDSTFYACPTAIERGSSRFDSKVQLFR